MLRVLLILTTIIWFLSAQAEDKCSLVSITQDCKDFKPDAPEKIMFPDGTYIYNFLHKGETNPLGGDPDTQGTLDTNLEQRLHLFKILKNIPATRMSDRFKQMLLRRPDELAQNYLRKPTAEKISIVWPPNSDAAVYQDMPVDDFLKKRSDVFTASELKELSSFLGYAKVVKEDTKLDALSTSTNLDPNRVKRMGELVKFARQSIVAVIAGKHAPPLTVEEQALVDKINSIYYIDPQDPSVAKKPICQGEIGNAFYESSTHTFTICPNILHNPDSTVLAIIAHEFTHSIDSCRSQGPLYEVHQDKLPKVEEGNNPRNAEINGLSQRNPETPFMNVAGSSTFDNYQDAANVEEFLKAGALTTKAPAVPFDKYPFHDAYQCLTSGTHAFESVKPLDVRRFAIEIERYRRQKGLPKVAAKAGTKEIKEAFSDKPQCLGINKSDQMTEVMADWMAAQVTGRYLKQHPPKSDKDRLGANSFFAMTACGERAELNSPDAAKKQSANETIISAQITFKRAMDPHPSSLKRFERVFMAEPLTREAMGCGPSAASTCFDSYSASAASASALASPSAKARAKALK